jgi:hypothetical protein
MIALPNMRKYMHVFEGNKKPKGQFMAENKTGR